MYKKENVKKFINYGMEETEGSVVIVFFLQLFVAVAGLFLDQNPEVIAANLLFTLLSLIICIVEHRKHSFKNQCLATGIISIIAAVQSLLFCALVYSTEIKRTLITGLIVLLLDLCVFGVIILISRRMLKAEKNFASKASEVAVTAIFAALGAIGAKQAVKLLDAGEILTIIFALASMVFVVFTVYLVKWYYIRLIEAM